MTRFRLVVVLPLLLATIAEAAPRRRAVASPSNPVQTPAVWLRLHAWPLQTAALSPARSDLDPLRTIVGEAGVVALGEATHGTHEFHTMRIRMIDWLVREMGFDVVVMEAPFPLLNRVNAYVNGEADSVQRILDHAVDLGYHFWDVREMHQLFDWARTYNATRGNRPPVEFAGCDTYDHRQALTDVVAFLRQVDPLFSAEAEASYSCVLAGRSDTACERDVKDVRDRIAAHRAAFAAATSFRTADDALQNATVVLQYLQGGTYGALRDRYLATNTLWLRDHRGQSRKVIVWAHQEHSGKTPITWTGNHDSMGGHLEGALGDAYVSIGTATRTGSYLQWQREVVTTGTFSSATAGGYESLFTLAGSAILLVPLPAGSPEWLRGPLTLQSAPANRSDVQTVTTSLPEKFDAIVYFDSTTPAQR